MLEQFRRDGFVVVPRLLESAEVEEWTVRLETLSGLRRGDFGRRAVAGPKRRGLVGAWTMPEGVSRTRDFWPIVLHDRLVAAVRQLFGPGASFLRHTDLHVGFSAPGWRRESASRTFREGPDWDESAEPYRIARAAIVLHSTDESACRLGVVPGTHRPGPVTTERRRIESANTWAGRLCGLFREDPTDASALWLRLRPGDCVLLDPRLLRAGTPLDGPKYSLSLAYGAPNRHFHRHRACHHHRPGLAGHDLDPELAGLLRGAGLYAREITADSLDGRAVFGTGRAQGALGRLRLVKARR
ncbi:MAG TPA: phytanoyl-CoA dioxygenase family protein [Vicinamibacteria bacterium]|nr:phytanoyl-CoA dioxygenase family protein [Vicinamibacteria bacterium]